MTSLSFKVPERIVGLSLEPIPRKRRTEPSEPLPEMEIVRQFEPEKVEKPEPPDEEEIQRRIEREAEQRARALAHELVVPVQRMVEEMLEKLQTEQEAFLAEVEQAAVRLAYAIARKIIRRELTAEPDLVLQTVREAVQKLAAASRITIRCHPDDLGLLQADKVLQKWLEAREAQVKFRADDQIERGGCVVESDAGTVDAQLKSQLSAIERELFELEAEH